MTIEIKFGHENFGNYKRLAYKWWYALAEFVDNSTQSYADNKETLDAALAAEGERFTVTIATGNDFVRVSDNAYGMDLVGLQRAMIVGVPPDNTSGRSRYGLGMKTAACWIGDEWKIVSTKLGECIEHTIEVDVRKVIQGDVKPPISNRKVPADAHYTVIEIRSHHRPLRGRTIGKVKDYLESIYRMDISTGSMLLRYNDAELVWKSFEDNDFLKRRDGTFYRESFIFEIEPDKKVVEGWVGVLQKGSRARAGFSILHRKRLIKGWPDSWRPEKVYGFGGRNDLINQRLVGEVNLEDFEVSHTKDEINWHGEEEEHVEAGLWNSCKPFMEAARKARRGEAPGHGPTDVQVDAAVRTLEEELMTPEFMNALELEDALPPAGQIALSNKYVVENAAKVEPTMVVTLSDMKVNVYLDSIGSPNDPYFVNEDVAGDELSIVVNLQHPHWHMLEGENAVVNYLRHCVYDGVAEHRASRRDRLESDTVKRLKDAYLRVAFEVLQSADEEAPEVEARDGS